MAQPCTTWLHSEVRNVAPALGFLEERGRVKNTALC